MLEADLENFFGSLDHEWVLKFIEYRVGDKRILNLIRKWLKAGALNEGEYEPALVGSPQGGPISVLISNIYLHYVLDLWVTKVVKPRLEGEIYYVRYLDDFILCFQYEGDAKKVQSALAKRLKRFSLKLQEEKTRLIRFGRFSAEKNRRRNKKQESIYFLGFTIYSDKSREGRFKLGFVTERSRRRRCKSRIKEVTLANRHLSVPDQHKQLKTVLRGMYNYYAIAGNHNFLDKLNHYAKLQWRKALSKRSQKAGYSWERFNKTLSYFPLPRAKIQIPYQKFDLFALL